MKTGGNNQLKPLYTKFFTEAKMNYEIAQFLIDRNLIPSALYNLQQAFEKGLKALHIFKSITLDDLSEKTAYDKAFNLKHNVQKSAMDILVEIGEYDKKKIKNSMTTISDSSLLKQQKLTITTIDGFLQSARNLPGKLRLEENYVGNIKEYDKHVLRYYKKYTDHNLAVNKLNQFNFLRLISCVGVLYPCLFKMDTITRYPDE